MNECLPWWFLPVAVVVVFVVAELSYNAGKKAAADEWINQMTMEFLKFKARLGERYMAEKDKARGEDA